MEIWIRGGWCFCTALFLNLPREFQTFSFSTQIMAHKSGHCWAEGSFRNGLFRWGHQLGMSLFPPPSSCFLGRWLSSHSLLGSWGRLDNGKHLPRVVEWPLRMEGAAILTTLELHWPATMLSSYSLSYTEEGEIFCSEPLSHMMLVRPDPQPSTSSLLPASRPLKPVSLCS